MIDSNCKSCLYICECCGQYDCSTCKPFGINFYPRRTKHICKLTGERIKYTHKYKVGDKVRVIKNLKTASYDDCSAVYEMVKYKNEIVTISDCYTSFSGSIRYRIAEDDGEWVWSEPMFE